MAHDAAGALLAPDPAVAEGRDGADAGIERHALLVARRETHLLAGRRTDLDIRQRQGMPVEQLRHFGGRRQSFALGAAVLDRLGQEGGDAGLQAISFRRHLGSGGGVLCAAHK